uniref:Zinc finger protein weckle n=1 Tax=Glossina brevipalpis TaxID=37001 RepID=A0A1A9W3Y4_9MUSC
MQSHIANLISNDAKQSRVKWQLWCRLCASNNFQNNINVFQDDVKLLGIDKETSLKKAIEKYFQIQILQDDTMPRVICSDCLSFIDCLVSFNDRMLKVQQMFAALSSNSEEELGDLEQMRLKYVMFGEKTNKDCTQLSLAEVHYFEAKHEVDVGKSAVNNEIPQEYNCHMHLKKEYSGEIEDINEEVMDIEQEGYQCREEAFYDVIEKNYRGQGEEKDPFSNVEEDKKKGTSAGIKRKKLKKSKHKNDALQEDIKLNVECKDCKVHFQSFRLYNKHLREMHKQEEGSKEWKCPTCEKIVSTSYHLERHLRTHVPLEERKVVSCSECDKRFFTNTQLESHVKYRHKNEKPFICEECGICLRTNANLRIHLLTHTDIAPFECEVCRKKFKDRTRLKTHMDIHSPNKHVCAMCGLQLNSRATLNRHLLVHSDEMQHKCDYCGRAFKRAKALKNHLILHTGLKPYACDFCDRTFANGSNCRSHKKKMHPEELAALEASGGGKCYTRNIPKLETLKAVTKGADNLTPVVTKQSGCFAFSKKSKSVNADHSDRSCKTKTAAVTSMQSTTVTEGRQTSMNSNLENLNLSNIPQVGSNNADVQVNETNVTTVSREHIPNFDKIYQHLMKRTSSGPTQLALDIKRPPSEISLIESESHEAQTQTQLARTENATCLSAHPFYDQITQQFNHS